MSDSEKQLRAKLQIAARMGLIDNADPAAVEERRLDRNRKIREELEAGNIVYGVRSYTPEMYLEYELTRFKLAFTVYRGEKIGDYTCHRVTEEEKRTFYEENGDLFTRYFGDSFSYEEVRMIIEKRLKEMEYERLVQSILC